MESCVHIQTADGTDGERSLTALLMARGHTSIDINTLVEGSMDGLTFTARLEKMLGWQVADTLIVQMCGEDSEAVTGPH